MGDGMITAIEAPQRQKSAPRSSQETTGLRRENEVHGGARGLSSERPLSQAWVTDDLLRDTQNVWSKAYGRPVSEDEAVEMLLNVKRLGEVLLKVNRSKGDAKA